MATRIDQAANGRKTVLCDVTGMGFTRFGGVLDAYQATEIPADLMVWHVITWHDNQRLAGATACENCREPLY